MIYKYSAVIVIMLAILGFAISMTYLLFQPQTTLTMHTKETPDAWMENVAALIMDKNGKPKLKIETPKMIHYVVNDSAYLTTPHLTLYRKSPIPWDINAKNAKTTQGIDHILFWGNVTIHHPADGMNPATLIKTLTLTVHPNKQIAETNDIITLIQPDLIVNATGMHADMNTGDIKLLSQARGEYVPHS